MRFPSFTVHTTDANFTFIQYAAVRNPNRYSFSHHGSSLQLISASAGPVGSIYIPAATIAAGRTQFVSATFLVKSFPVGDAAQGAGVSAVADSGSVVGPGPNMELETRMTLVGSVKVVQVFSHHVEVSARCRVSVRVADGSILGYNC
ncbi:uncharacterized protein LOC141587448 [Silene latifolia]|uniref:uncharacterized protein LOC141587448 n=1 Tax=Silene latifolia TaxID=37657 RepID=UPI003D787424